MPATGRRGRRSWSPASTCRSTNPGVGRRHDDGLDLVATIFALMFVVSRGRTGARRGEAVKMNLTRDELAPAGGDSLAAPMMIVLGAGSTRKRDPPRPEGGVSSSINVNLLDEHGSGGQMARALYRRRRHAHLGGRHALRTAAAPVEPGRAKTRGTTLVLIVVPTIVYDSGIVIVLWSTCVRDVDGAHLVHAWRPGILDDVVTV